MKHICLAGPCKHGSDDCCYDCDKGGGCNDFCTADEPPEECTVRRATGGRTIEYKGYDIFQSHYNNHVNISKGGEVLCYISSGIKLSDEALKSLVDTVLMRVYEVAK